MKLEWSAAAGADLERFAAFLHGRMPGYSALVAETIVAKSRILLDHPFIGRPLDLSPDYRELVVHALRAAYVLHYRVAADRIVILRVFHGREARD